MDELEQIIADQMDEIDRLREALKKSEGRDVYYEDVYDRIWESWNAFALAEIGTSQPSHLDLQSRPELAKLYEAIR